MTRPFTTFARSLVHVRKRSPNVRQSTRRRYLIVQGNTTRHVMNSRAIRRITYFVRNELPLEHVTLHEACVTLCLPVYKQLYDIADGIVWYCTQLLTATQDYLKSYTRESFTHKYYTNRGNSNVNSIII